ncbi:MAG: hypothetical protein ONB46_25175 [candidate division KSB1 bacterium]|nr:hypothetical protein [candidate division KSB1 bacterium]MDZ7369177.1 hypothetical protein [candidate division KSB1 bacterium]MDZ7407175.1 hypothetical protein [candidate division KSB1 bacterium]
MPPYPNDPNNWFPHDDPVALRDYAETHRHSINGQSMNYHFLSVNYARINRQASWLQISGVAVDGPDNQTPTPTSERFSIIFWGDILTWGDLTPGGSGGDQSIREVVVLVSAHELAHQRIQLTRFSVSPQFHNQGQMHCAMRRLTTEVPAFYRLRPEFCYDNDTNTSNSCRDWLKQANP